MAQIFDYQVGTEVPLELRYLDSGIPVVGLTAIKVQLRDTKTGNYLDFNDQTWKASGWTTKQVTLSEVGDGSYQYLWNSATAVMVSMIIAAEYEVQDSGYEEETTDFLLFGVAALDPSTVASAVWDKQTSAHQVPGSFGLLVQVAAADIDLVKEIETGRWKILNDQLILYKSDNVTEVARFDLFDRDGAPTEDHVFDRIKT